MATSRRYILRATPLELSILVARWQDLPRLPSYQDGREDLSAGRGRQRHILERHVNPAVKHQETDRKGGRVIQLRCRAEDSHDRVQSCKERSVSTSWVRIIRSESCCVPQDTETIMMITILSHRGLP